MKLAGLIQKGIPVTRTAFIGKINLKLDSVVYVGEGPEVDEVTLEETFPEEVAAKGWWICYSDELVQDVIDNAIYQKPDVSLEEINIAIGYYCQNDCFQTL